MDVTFNAMTSGALLMLAALVALRVRAGAGRWPPPASGHAAGRWRRCWLGVAMTMTRSAELGVLAGVGAMLLDGAAPPVRGHLLGSA
jgi:hypothetical protein